MPATISATTLGCLSGDIMNVRSRDIPKMTVIWNQAWVRENRAYDEHKHADNGKAERIVQVAFRGTDARVIAMTNPSRYHDPTNSLPARSIVPTGLQWRAALQKSRLQ